MQNGATIHGNGAPPGNRRVLVVGREAQAVRSVVGHAVSPVETAAATDVFDAIAEAHGGNFNAVLADEAAIAHRPTAAATALSEAAGGALVHLYGPPDRRQATDEVRQRVPQVGGFCATPLTEQEVRAVLGPTTHSKRQHWTAAVTEALTIDALLSAQVDKPGRGLATVVKKLDEAAGDAATIRVLPEFPDAAEAGTICQALGEFGVLEVTGPPDQEAAIEKLAEKLARPLAKLAQLDARHGQIQKLAYSDELTGLYNARFFKQFLARMLERSRQQYTPVTLLLFDIDNFKQYNDKYGHGVGDEILRQTAQLIRRCCRDHDLVARISGDEFAVVFWEKEGPRTPRDPAAATAGRAPQTPLQIADRFRRMMDRTEFDALGESGRGKLTISGGMAVFPFDADSPEALVKAADRALMFDAKQHGKNTIALVAGANGNGHQRRPSAG
jgi:diguanylate cyclase (GGDEF)-like protein